MNTFKNSLAFFCFMVASGAALAQPLDTKKTDFKPIYETASKAAILDWQPGETKHEDGKACLCDGHFAAPENNQAHSDLEPSLAPMDLTADSSNHILGSNLLEFDGDVLAEQGNLNITGDKLIYDKATQDVTIEGDVRIREPGSLITGSRGVVSRSDNSAELKNASYLIHQSGANGDAEEIKRTGDGQISMHDASYTMCLPTSNAWRIRAEDITLDPKTNEGRARHSRLYIKDVPVLYVPYFTFPLNNKRKSGFLFPAYSSVDGGSDISVPYYVNLAPNYDLTLTPRYVSSHGAMLGAEARYLDEKNYALASGSYLPNEVDFDSDDPNNNTKRRWLAAFKENGRIDDAGRLTHSIDFQRVSDGDYFEDLGTSGLDVRREAQLRSDANIAYQAKKWDAELYVESYQELKDNLDGAYRRLPQLSFNYYDNYKNGIYTGFSTEYAYFDHPDSNENTTGRRLYYAPEIGIRKASSAAKIEVKTGFKATSYNLRKNVNDFDDPDALLPNFKIDGSLFFERDMANNRRQIVEPRIQYYYAQSKDQDQAPIFDTTERAESYTQLFNEERFTGRDRISDANRITLGLNTKIFDNANQRSLEAGIAQQYHFRNRNTSLLDTDQYTGDELTFRRNQLDRNESNIATYLNYDSGKQWRINSEHVYDPDQAELDSSSFNYHIASSNGNKNILNLGYQYKRDANRYLDNQFLEDDLHQISASTIFEATKNISVIALANYDLSARQSREELIGLEYNSCCWRTRLAFHREEKVDTNPINKDIDYEHAVRFEIQLKGLSSLSDNISRILSQSIEGFDIREKNYQ